ncbi:MAG: hypothetical protein NE327_21060 [Lentisphaeraceae bacterium]|nr:hypothetical protein [Lentisphaeraceae bacterium]
MKSAIYIEDGLYQLVITPETEFEKNVVSTMQNKGLLKAEINRGYFSECNGGYVRQFDKNQSIILTVRDEVQE